METPEADDKELETPEAEDEETTEVEASEPEEPAEETADVEDQEAEPPEPEESAEKPAEAEDQEAESSEPEEPEKEPAETEDQELEEPTEEIIDAVDKDVEPAVQEERVPIFKQILFYAAIAISGIFLLISLLGIIGGWVINTPTTEAALAVLTSFDDALQRMEEASINANAALAELSTGLENADQKIQEAGEELADTNLLLEVISRITDQEIQPNMTQTRDNIRSIYDTVLAIEQAIATINAIPFIDIEIPGEEEISSIRTGMEEMAVAVTDLREEVQQRREDRAENLVEIFSAPVNRLNSRVEELQSRLSEIEARLATAIERTNFLKDRIPLWIDIVSILNTLVFGWFMFSQGAVILLCWRALHPKESAAAG